MPLHCTSASGAGVLPQYHSKFFTTSPSLTFRRMMKESEKILIIRGKVGGEGSGISKRRIDSTLRYIWSRSSAVRARLRFMFGMLRFCNRAPQSETFEFRLGH